MKMIGGKWKLPILCALAADGSTRYNDLKRKLGGISNTMLAKSLTPILVQLAQWSVSADA